MTSNSEPRTEPMSDQGRAARSSIPKLIVTALVVVLVADLVARVVGSQLAEPLVWYDATTQLKAEQLDGLAGQDIDDVIIGTSMTLRGFDTQTYVDETGRSAYNAALPGAVPAVTERWLLEEVVPSLEPDRVVLGIQTIDFSSVLHEDNLERWEGARATRTGILGSLDRMGATVSGLVKHRQELRDPGAWLNKVRGTPGPVEDARGTLTDLGFRDVYTDDFTDAARDRTANELAVMDLDSATDALRRMAAALDALDIELVLVEMPVSQAYIDLHPEGQTSYDEVRAHYRAVADQLGAELIDLATGWDADERFTDYTHLDLEGAQRVARSLADQLG